MLVLLLCCRQVMAEPDQAATYSYADLPADLVRRIFASAGDPACGSRRHQDPTLSVADR